MRSFLSFSIFFKHDLWLNFGSRKALAYKNIFFSQKLSALAKRLTIVLFTWIVLLPGFSCKGINEKISDQK